MCAMPQTLHKADPPQILPRFLNLRSPPFNPIPLTPHGNAQILVLHTLRILQEMMSGHPPRIRPIDR